jgi:hypothetical protein
MVEYDTHTVNALYGSKIYGASDNNVASGRQLQFGNLESSCDDNCEGCDTCDGIGCNCDED